MKVKISTLSFSSLWNGEYVRFITQIVDIFKSFDADALHLLKALGALLAMLPDLAKLQAQEMGSTITQELIELDAAREAMFISIVEQLRGHARGALAALAEHVKVMVHFFDVQGRDIAREGYNEETQRLVDLFKAYDANPKVQAAAAALNLTAYFDQLRANNEQFDAKFGERNKEKANIEHVDSEAIRAATTPVLKDLYGSIEHCSREYDKLDYTGLANEINNLTTYYETQLHARAARRKNGVDVSKEKPIE